MPNKAITDAIQAHKKLIDQFEHSGIDTVTSAVEMITDCLKNGGGVYICGNGGSAADSQHIACELVGRFRRERKALPIIAFSTDTSVITAIGNDYNFDELFTRQVEAFVKPGDILWALSTSGSSTNVVAAAKLAKQKGAKVIAFTGRAKSKLEQISDLCLCLEAEWTSTAQEGHQLAYHIICDLVEQNFTQK